MQAIRKPVSEARCIGDVEPLFLLATLRCADDVYLPPSDKGRKARTGLRVSGGSLYTSLDRRHGAAARLLVGPCNAARRAVMNISPRPPRLVDW
jgi:hypothetical protein